MSRIPIIPMNGDVAEPEIGGIERPLNFADLVHQNPSRHPAVIDGVLREGAVGTLISSTKSRKSWAVAALIAAVLTGGNWFGFPVAQGRVLLIDGELTHATILHRLKTVFSALKMPLDQFRNLDFYSLRGNAKGVLDAKTFLSVSPPGTFKLVVMDPLSCFYPDDSSFSENDNAAMRRLFDGMIGLATRTRAAIMIVHHLSKGPQSEKPVVDLGAGAGAVARAVDAHLVFRGHQEKECVVLDGAVRDFPEITPAVWRWKFPLYLPAPELSANDLSGRRGRRGDARKNKPVQITLDQFIATYVDEVPRALAYMRAKAREAGISGRAVKDYIADGEAVGKIHAWTDQTDTRKRLYATIPPPAIPVTTAKIRKKPRKPL